MKDKLSDAGVSNDAANVAAKLIAGGAAAAIGGVAGGRAGAATGLNGDANNRQLHPEEKARIKQLAGGDYSKEARLTAAACALVKCYAEYPETSGAYQQLKQLADYGASDAFARERAQLSGQLGMFAYTTTGMFSDSKVDAAKKLTNTYQIGTRLVGTGKMALGAVGVIGSAVTAPVSCATGIGCFANAAAATISLDTAYSGSKQLISGNPTETYLNQGLQSLGMSPQAAGWAEAGLGMGSAATAWSVANKAVEQTIALNKAAVGSYRNAIVGDEPNSLTKAVGAGNSSVTAEISALKRIAANNSIDTGSAARIVRIDELSQANWGRHIDEMVNSQEYVFRYLTESGLASSIKYNSIRGYASTNFSSSSSEIMSRAQIFEKWPGAPYTGPVLYGVAIPVDKLNGLSVARPMGGAATTGWESFANSYPKAGAGGYSQFLINSVPLNDVFLFGLHR